MKAKQPASTPQCVASPDGASPKGMAHIFTDVKRVIITRQTACCMGCGEFNGHYRFEYGKFAKMTFCWKCIKKRSDYRAIQDMINNAIHKGLWV